MSSVCRQFFNYVFLYFYFFAALRVVHCEHWKYIEILFSLCLIENHWLDLILAVTVLFQLHLGMGSFIYYTTSVVERLLYHKFAVNTVLHCARQMEITLTQPC